MNVRPSQRGGENVVYPNLSKLSKKPIEKNKKYKKYKNIKI